MSRLASLISDALGSTREAGAARSVRPGRSHKPNDGSLNKTEEAYRDYLELLKRAGAIDNYWVHFLKIRLAKATFFDSDFLVQAKDGTLEIHEVKGWMEDDAAVKIKVLAALAPFRIILVKRQGKDGWSRKELNP